ncbi:hypothetical protein DFH06DRAFT_143388 [Mycena polygramma]|nr:hypothetical protein DFH06DRAFT_143388 [Mycena polygramma]
MADLPQELIDAIVEEVDDENDLPACSLAARAFVDPSQRRLFRSLSLRWDLGWDSLDRALAFLHQFPHLVPHVRDVSLDIPMDSKNQETLEAILRMLGNIEHLVIEGRGARWQQVTTALGFAIYDILSMPSLQQLHIFRIDDIPASLVLHAASSLCVLSLYSVDVRTSQLPLDIGPLRLGSFSLPFWPTCQFLLRRCPFLLAARALRKLAVYVDEQGHHRTLTAASSSHLRHLELECRAFLIPLDLPHLPSLHTMSLSFTVSESTPRVWILPALLRPTITALPAVAPNLDTLILTVLIPRDKCLPWRDRSALPFFADTYSSPTYKQHLPRLRKINCVLGYADPFSLLSGHFALAYEGFPGYMESKLRAAHAAGIVTVARDTPRSRLDYLH